jgi:hypothetical protein
MTLFKRKSDVEEVPHCPTCGERVPEKATECAMCGQDLEASPPRFVREKVNDKV